MTGINTEIPEEERQPTRRGAAEKPRTFDQTFLDTEKQDIVHRDYLAHAFRWGFAKDHYIEHEKTRVLDVGCGPNRPLMTVLFGGIGTKLAKSYVGVDMSDIKPTRHKRTTLYPKTNFLTSWPEIAEEHGPFDLITCFEVIEHMPRAEGDQLLDVFSSVLDDDGVVLLSTPVYDGARAKNHIHEYTVPELQHAVWRANFHVIKRYGTFMNHHEVKRLASPAQWEVYEQLREYYSQEIMATFLAPLFPDHSRNNLWVLEHAK